MISKPKTILRSRSHWILAFVLCLALALMVVVIVRADVLFSQRYLGQGNFGTVSGGIGLYISLNYPLPVSGDITLDVPVTDVWKFLKEYHLFFRGFF